VKAWFFRLLLALVLLGLGFWLWQFLFPNPERLIRKQLTELAQAASVPANEAPAAGAWNAMRLADFFTTDVQVRIEAAGHGPQSFDGRDELIRAATAARSQISGLQIEFPGMNIVVAPEKDSAIVELTATAKVPGETNPFVQELKVVFKKVGRTWLITRMETVKSLG
jgi:hypothetical protein